MFEVFWTFATAFQQAMLLLAALVCMALGVALIGAEVSRRIRGVRVEGTIIGVREMRPRVFHNVYRFVLPSGEAIEATSDSGSSSMTGRQTGRVVRLIVSRDNPERVGEAGVPVAALIGLGLALIGLWPGRAAWSLQPLGPLTFVVLGCVVAGAIARFRRYLIPKAERKSLMAWRAERHARRVALLAAVPIQQIDDLLAATKASAPAGGGQSTPRFVAPLLSLIGVALLVPGAHLTQESYERESSGLRTSGVVSGLERRADSDGWVYYPKVRFRTGSGKWLVFTADAGSNPPSYRPGDTVSVLYMRDNPKASAIIDHGVWNWLPAVAVLLSSVVLLVVGLRMLSRDRSVSAGS